MRRWAGANVTVLLSHLVLLVQTGNVALLLLTQGVPVMLLLGFCIPYAMYGIHTYMLHL